MIILLHVLAAMTSIVFASHLFHKPSKSGLKVHYGLVGATIATGTYLVLNAGARMLETCLEGVAYLAVISIASVLVHQRLAAQTAAVDSK